MYLPPNKQEVIQKSREYFKTLITEAKPVAFTLNVSLTSNPFIKDRDGFKFLKFQLAEYNKRVEKGEVKDIYEMLSYQKMFSMLSDLSQMQTRDDQITALDSLCQWYKEQSRLVRQRYDQGEIRYEMSKQYRDCLKYMPQKQVIVQEKQLDIPFYLIERIIQPYRRHWRTLHNELENPTRRLQQYKRKTINIATFADQKEDTKPPRVLYPVPPKYEEPKEQQPQVKPPEGQPPAEGTEGQPPPQGQPAEGAAPQDAAPEQPDLGGGLGEQPQEPDEDEPPEDVPDKLKPKNPIYVDAISVDKQKKYKQAYMFYLGTDIKQERNMELRYVRKYHDVLRKQKQDIQEIQIAHDWARRKARITKDNQKKLEEMKFKSEYSLSREPAPPEQRIAPLDQLKFGFTTVARTRSKTNDVDLTLPELSNTSNLVLQEKTIRRDRLASLRTKFAKVLNLTEHESRQSAPSLCQYTSRRRGLSQIIRNHSHSRQRLQQLQEVGAIKQKLTKVKININIKALSRGLCLPENQDFFSDRKQEFPAKMLPSNPDLVETKKKKKKK